LPEVNPISLLELQGIVKQAIDALPDAYWVRAEINELNVSSVGHCFLELVQKSEKDERLEAKASASIWANVFRMVKPYFESKTGTSLSAGMKVMLRVVVQYHELYGLRLNVVDIDPAYTVGEVELQRRKTIACLQKEGVFDMNRELEFPLLPARVAVISSEKAAGYGDFMRQLHNNPYGYKLQTALFAAAMQGKDTEPDIIAALESINKQIHEFDVVAILRGGGSQSDLSFFDSYLLANNVAQFPLPVITGIGHDKDISVVDMVAHTMLKTPTAAAEFLLEQFEIQEQYLSQLAEQLNGAWQNVLENSRNTIRYISGAVHARVLSTLSGEQGRVELHVKKRLQQAVKFALNRQQQKIQGVESGIRLLDPQQILKRGYSITLQNGRRLSSVSEVVKESEITTILSDGRIISKLK
jgi:exodeoxyribonuclease VII large subunit